VTDRETQWCIEGADLHGWPYGPYEAAYVVLGGGFLNSQGRTFKSLHRRVMHALEVWEEKYGPFSFEQEMYASKLLEWAIRKGASDAQTNGVAPHPYILNLLAQLVNHEKSANGFKRRATDTTGMDFSHLLKAVPR
jgi:hypothetical protein